MFVCLVWKQKKKKKAAKEASRQPQLIEIIAHPMSALCCLVLKLTSSGMGILFDEETE